MTKRMKKCKVCGKVFTAAANNQKYCSLECKRTLHPEQCRKYREKKQWKVDSSDLNSVALAATNAGMTYGNYVAREGL